MKSKVKIQRIKYSIYIIYLKQPQTNHVSEN